MPDLSMSATQVDLQIDTIAPSAMGYAYRQYLTTVPAEYADLLGIVAGDVLVERVITVAVAGRLLLTSTSFLPPTLVDDSPAWKQSPIGKLALVDYPLTATGAMELRGRLPTTAEGKALNIPMGSDLPVTILSQAYCVARGKVRMRAGVVVVARGDRVVLRWGPGTAGVPLMSANAD